jgi:hypothetical protein
LKATETFFSIWPQQGCWGRLRVLSYTIPSATKGKKEELGLGASFAHPSIVGCDFRKATHFFQRNIKAGFGCSHVHAHTSNHFCHFVLFDAQ